MPEALALTDDEARNCAPSPGVSIFRRRYETSTLVGARAGAVFPSRLCRARFLLCCGTAPASGRLWRRGLRSGPGLRVDRWFLGLAQSLRLGAGILVAAAASPCEMGAGARLLQQPPLLLPPRPLALEAGRCRRRPVRVSVDLSARPYGYRGTCGSISRLQRSIPPAMLVQFSTPCSRSQPTTCRLRMP